MSFPFSDLYPFVRAVIGDTDCDIHLYEDRTIDAHLGLLSMEHHEWPLDENQALHFLDLPMPEKARIVLHCSRALIIPTPNTHSYRTPILSVSRSGGPTDILIDVERRIANLEARLMVGYDCDLWALLQYGNDRLVHSEPAAIPGIGFTP